MQQRNFDFDHLRRSEPSHIAEATSLPPPESVRNPPPLVRPDRQFTFGGVRHYEWPAPPQDHDTISVDRIRDDIDGPPHRFVIHLGDTVEVFFGVNRADIGEVTGISHANQQVCVSVYSGSKKLWVDTDRVYPTVEDLSRPSRTVGPLSELTTQANAKPPAAISEADCIPQLAAPYTFDEYKKFRHEFAEGSLSYSEYREQFARLLTSREALVGELQSRFRAKELAVIASRLGAWRANGDTKDANAQSIYRRILSSFVLDGTVSYALGERYEDAVKKKVESVTPEDLQRVFDERKAKVQEQEKALANPETFLEFRTFLQAKSEADLTDEQLARYDALHADMTRGRRAAEVVHTVEQFQSSELRGYTFQIKEGYHDKRQCPLWIVQLSSRVERATFEELNRKAKMLGGRYSSFKKTDAGFQFWEEQRARRFAALLSEDADRTDVLESRKERRELSASERLHELANELASRADDAIERSDASLQNTVRRADMQAGIRGRAYADQALARTMHSIAEALSCGNAKYLDGIRHKSQIETLDMLLRVAQFARLRETRHTRNDARQQPDAGDVRYANYPYPTIYRRHLEAAAVACQSTRGAKRAGEAMQKYLRRNTDEYLSFRAEHDVTMLVDFVDRLKQLHHDTEVFGWALEKYQRLQRSGITDIHELRAALREYLAHRAPARGDDPVQVAERELIGKELPGFFPTPPRVVTRMLELARISPEQSVLEPSCGKGDILDAVKAQYPEMIVHAIEQNCALAEVLSAKGHEVEFGDFLQHQATYDRIVMNPPFEHGQDIDHIRHAFDQLARGGRLVSVISEGPFFRGDKKSVAFRDWLAERQAIVERLPDGAFTGVQAFRETSVRTRLVTITKEANA